MLNTTQHIVYQFLDETDGVLYVGRTARIEHRLRQEHFTIRGHLPLECYRQTKMILYATCVSEDDAKIKERYLINTQSPRFNDQMNNGSRFDFVIKFDWTYMSVDKSKLDSAVQVPPKLQAPRVAKPLRGINFPSFAELRDSLGFELTADFSTARIDGPDQALTWLDGKLLDQLIRDTWAALSPPGLLSPLWVLEIAYKVLAAQDWVGYTFFASGSGRIVDNMACGRHNNLIRWRTSSEFADYMLPWYQTHPQTEVLCTTATNLQVTQRLYTDRENYLLALIYVRDLMLTSQPVDNRFLIVPYNIFYDLVPDWFLHQVKHDGYQPILRDERVKLNQLGPSLISGKSPEAEAKRQWQRVAYRAGKPLAEQLGREVWVYDLDEARQFRYIVECELKRLLDGATSVVYHSEPKVFGNEYKISQAASLSWPVGRRSEQ